MWLMRRRTNTPLLIICLLTACTFRAAAAADAVNAQTDNIRALVRDWVAAWSSGEFTTYADYYLEDFNGEFATPAAWREERRRRIAGRRDIDLDVGSVLVRLDAGDPRRAQAIFVQRYVSKTWCDVVEKTLDLELTRAGWRIAREAATTRARC